VSPRIERSVTSHAIPESGGFRPAPDLAQEVLAYFFVEGAPTTSRRRIVPDGSIDLIFNLGSGRGLHGTHREAEAAIVGVATAAFDVVRPPAAPVFGVVLSPGACRAVLGVNARELRNRVVGLEEVLGPIARVTLDRLRGARDVAGMVAVADATLRRTRGRSVPSVVTQALQAIRSPGGGQSLRSLQEHLGLSERKLQRLFDEHVGVSPKTLSRIARFEAARARLLAGGSSAAEVAADLGYADQAHMIREFRDFAGETPGRYRSVRQHRPGFRALDSLSDSFNPTDLTPR